MAFKLSNYFEYCCIVVIVLFLFCSFHFNDVDSFKTHENCPTHSAWLASSDQVQTFLRLEDQVQNVNVKQRKATSSLVGG